MTVLPAHRPSWPHADVACHADVDPHAVKTRLEAKPTTLPTDGTHLLALQPQDAPGAARRPMGSALLLALRAYAEQFLEAAYEVGCHRACLSEYARLWCALHSGPMQQGLLLILRL